MTELLMKEGTFFHNMLLEDLNKNVEIVIDIKLFAEDIMDITSKFTQTMSESSRKFLKKTKDREYRVDETIGILNRYTLEVFTELSKKVSSISKKIENEIIDPLDHFVNSHLQLNKNILRKSEGALWEIDANSEFLRELTRNFTSNADSGLSAHQRNQLKQIYESEMEKCNDKWQEIKKTYRNILAQADSSNASRVIFVNKVQSKLMRAANRLLVSSIVQQRLVEYDEYQQENEMFSFIMRERIREEFGTSNLFEEESLEDVFNDPNVRVNVQVRKEVDEFTEVFTSRSHIKEEDNNQYQHARNCIIEESNWGAYFLQRMQANIHTEIRLSSVKYHELTTIIKYLFAWIVEHEGNEAMVYNLLYISYRLTNGTNYIIQEIGKYEDFWQDHERWFKLIEYLKFARKTYKNKAQPFSRRQFLVGLWKMHASRKKITTEKQIKSQKFITQSRDYQIFFEINYYMARLELPEKYIFHFIVELANRFGLSRENTEKLLKFHYFHRKVNVNRMDFDSLRKKRLETKYRNLDRLSEKAAICIGKSLKYLKVGPEVTNLRLVCKRWNKYLKEKIFQRFLIFEKNGTLVEKHRLPAYLAVCESAYSRDVFARMLNEMPDFTEHADIIELDARRSLAWDQSLRGTLVDLLKVYAFYHPQVGYLQGMNYLCENILKLTDDRFIAYRIFEYLMNHQFSGLYTYDFQQLRAKIYQLMRVLQKHLPKLYDHFQAQKLEGQHFLLSWAITLWGQMSGELCWVLWDGFVINGWKWWIKTVLWLLKTLEQELLAMNFQEMMKCFSDIHSTLLCCSSLQLKQFGINFNTLKSDIEAIPLEDEILVDLEKQYKLKVSMVRDYLKKVKSTH